MMEFLFIIVSVLIGGFVGNYGGDQKTFKDCATNGEARMLGGGTIKCEVKKGGAA